MPYVLVRNLSWLQVCGTFRSAEEGQKLAPIDDELEIILSELVDTCSAEVGVGCWCGLAVRESLHACLWFA